MPLLPTTNTVRSLLTLYLWSVYMDGNKAWAGLASGLRSPRGLGCKLPLLKTFY